MSNKPQDPDLSVPDEEFVETGRSVIDEQALVLSDQPVVVPNDLMFMGKAMAASGFFRDSRRASQAIVKILVGREMGIGPAAAMTGLHVFDGKVVISAGLMASLIKRSDIYDYKVRELGETAAEIEFFEHGQSVGSSRFTIEDAQRANLLNKPGPWKQYPRNMLYARAMSNGARWYCAGIFGGSVYDPEELDQDTPPAWESEGPG